jgi:uncharacterized delta-60 repeat protein
MPRPGARRARRIGKVRPRAEGLEGRRLLAAGDLVPGFGDGGIVVAPFHGADPEGGVGDALRLPDGKILVAGGGGASFYLGMGRYNADGSVDRSFGADGFATAWVPGGSEHFFSGAAVAPDGSIYLAGDVVVITDTSGPIAEWRLEGVVAKYDASGHLDAGFGRGGFLLRPDWYEPMPAVQADGKVVVSAFREERPDDLGSAAIVAARLNADGTPDASFGDHGETSLVVPGGFLRAGHALALQGDGKAVVLATQGTYGAANIFVARYDTSGHLDDAFGRGGMVLTDLDGGSTASALAIQPDGKLVVAGGGAATRIEVLRLDADGRPDPTFGRGGRVEAWLAGGPIVHAAAVQPDGKILVGGGLGGGFLMLRFNPGGDLDGTFGAYGVVRTPIRPAGGELQSLSILPGGAILAVGAPLDINRGTVVFAEYAGATPPNPPPPPPDTTGPTVTRLRRQGIHREPSRLVVTFSEPLDAASAGNPGNYRLIRVSPAALRPVAGRPVPIRAAVYDPATWSVTLVPRGPLSAHRRYALTINGRAGGLTDRAGNPLDGDRDGTPGGDAAIAFGAESLGLSRAPRRPAGSRG